MGSIPADGLTNPTDRMATGKSIKLLIIFVLSFAVSETSFADTTFKVGLVLPLTGPVADYGIAIQNSINLALKDRPELFTNIQFRYEDAQGSASNAVSAFNKLLQEDQINLSVTFGVAFCKVLAPIAESKKLPLVGLCLDPTVAANRRYVLRFKNTTDEIMIEQTKFLLKKGVKKIGLVLGEHSYFEELTAALRRNLMEDQTLTIIDQVPTDQMDLHSTILKLKNKRSDYDSVGVFLWIGQVSNFYRQLKELAVDVPTFGSDLFESTSEIKSSNGLMEGVPFSGVEVKPAFIERYRKAYHQEGQLAFGAPAYEFALAVGELFNQGGYKLSADEIMAKFSAIGSRDGTAAGPYKYVNDPKAGQYFQFPIVIKKVVGEGFEVIP